MKYHIITYGCQLNRSDSERIASILESDGYKPASSIKEADLIVVNMCSVRQSAVDRIYGLIPKLEKLKNKNLKLKTVLTGCILKKDRKNFAKGFDKILRISNLLKYHPKYRSDFSAFVPISNGCNNFCTYCVVPLTRGPLICRSDADILREVKGLIKRGFKEIWLLGQNVNDYRSPVDSSINFAQLLKMINDIPGDFWIRFTSPHPSNFSDQLIETMAKCQKITPYLNLPIQSGDDEILKKMNRTYTTKEYKNLVKKIKTAFKKHRKGLEKKISLSTDIIVGFSGETKKQFENTANLLKEIKYDMAYIAQYSPRPQTAAFLLKDDISPKEKERRYRVLSDILKKTALENNKKYIGKRVEVLVNESRIMNNELRIFFGKTRTYKTVKVYNSKPQPICIGAGPCPYMQGQEFLIHNSNLTGQFVKVKITKATSFGLRARLI